MRDPIHAAPITVVPAPVLKARRADQVAGLTRRTLMRRAIGAGIGLWVIEVLGGTAGFLWSAVALAAPKVAVGTLADLVAANPGSADPRRLPRLRPGGTGLRRPGRPGSAVAGNPASTRRATAHVLNVRALSQRCPHLGCRPNPCIEDGWFHCPCHQSRYDRLGIKAAGEAFGPAPRGMDRYAIRSIRPAS